MKPSTVAHLILLVFLTRSAAIGQPASDAIRLQGNIMRTVIGGVSNEFTAAFDASFHSNKIRIAAAVLAFQILKLNRNFNNTDNEMK